MSLIKSEYETLLSVGDVKPQLQVNYYFYCDGMPADVMLRVRLKKGEYLLCYKKLLSNEQGVNICDERERKLDETCAKTLLSEGITPQDLKSLVDVDLPHTCKYVGYLNTNRSKFMFNGLLIELDKNEYLGTTDYELECECDSMQRLQQLKDYLYDRYGVHFRQSSPKSARFFAKYFGGN